MKPDKNVLAKFSQETLGNKLLESSDSSDDDFVCGSSETGIYCQGMNENECITHINDRILVLFACLKDNSDQSSGSTAESSSTGDSDAMDDDDDDVDNQSESVDIKKEEEEQKNKRKSPKNNPTTSKSTMSNSTMSKLYRF
jgi:hypothetical protein